MQVILAKGITLVRFHAQGYRYPEGFDVCSALVQPRHLLQAREVRFVNCSFGLCIAHRGHVVKWAFELCSQKSVRTIISPSITSIPQSRWHERF